MRILERGDQHTLTEALELVSSFLQANPGISRKLNISFAGDHPRLKCRGYYRPHQIVIFNAQCTRPGLGYSWPGHRSDRTLLGVTAHELGHHVHYCRPDMDPSSGEMPRERRVSGYEPDYAERVAETMRLFILNPDLLARARPLRYAYLVDLGLRSIETRGWREVLGAIPPHQLRTLDNWMPPPEAPTQAEMSL